MVETEIIVIIDGKKQNFKLDQWVQFEGGEFKITLWEQKELKCKTSGLGTIWEEAKAWTEKGKSPQT